jgi:hypothetical protein
VLPPGPTSGMTRMSCVVCTVSARLPKGGLPAPGVPAVDGMRKWISEREREGVQLKCELHTPIADKS